MKCQTTDEAFQEQYFLWEKGASLGADFELLNFQDLLHAQKVYKIPKERKMISKHNMSPLRIWTDSGHG